MSYYDEVSSIEHSPTSLEESFLVKGLSKLRASTGGVLKIQEVEGKRARVVYPEYLKPYLDNHAGEHGLSFPEEEGGENFLCLGEQQSP